MKVFRAFLDGVGILCLLLAIYTVMALAIAGLTALGRALL